MNSIIIKFFNLPLLLILFNFCLFMSSCENDMYRDLSDEDKMLYRFINQQGKILGEKYKMHQSGNGLEGWEKVETMSILFQRFGDPLTEKEARKLIISCANDFIIAVNNNSLLKSLLKDYPFSSKNLDMTIINADKNHNDYFFPYITVVKNIRGKINFLTEDPSTKYGFHTDKSETYEEAVAILKQENSAD